MGSSVNSQDRRQRLWARGAQGMGGGGGDIKKEKNEAAEVSWTTGLQNNFLREV